MSTHTGHVIADNPTTRTVQLDTAFALSAVIPKLSSRDFVIAIGVGAEGQAAVRALRSLDPCLTAVLCGC